MIEPGEYKTREGLKAMVKEVSEWGLIGWVQEGGYWRPRAWFTNGKAYITMAKAYAAMTTIRYDLDLPRTITVPETELPEPIRIFNLNIIRNLGYSGDPFYHLSIKIHLKTEQDAEQWVAWWRQIAKANKC